MDLKQAFAELGLSPGAPREAIVAAYRQRVKSCHPDNPQGDSARFLRLKDAYEYLTKGAGAEAAQAAYRGRTRGADITMEIRVPLETILRGGTSEIRARASACRDCGGTGRARPTDADICLDCGGTGRGVVTRGIIRLRTVCSKCGGTGRAAPHRTCKICGGQGQDPHAEPFDVSIPAGTAEGAVLRYDGRGGPGGGGGPAGDLLLTVKTEPHPKFRRRGSDLATTARVSFSDLVLGGKTEVAPLAGGGALPVSFRAGTQAGTVVTLEGYGLPDGKGGHGRLMVHLQPRIPAKPTPEQISLLRRWSETERAG